jgi:subtilase family serine protease
MKYVCIALIAIAFTLSANVLLAQAADASLIYVSSPLRISDHPQNPAGPTGILPVQFKAAYGFNRIANLGQGQTIAIVDPYDNPNIEADLAVYQAQFHLTPCNFHKVKVGNPVANPGWGVEIALDVEQVCALAPQANIILVEANSIVIAEMMAAVQVAHSAPQNATVVSMSWGSPDFPGELMYDSFFCNILNGNGQPVTFVAASGDAGHHPEYPSTSPCVIAAGGTTLALSQVTPLSNPMRLNYGHEVAWNFSGGGVSANEPQMSWQNPGCATWSTTNRCVPDVSSVAQQIPVYSTFGASGWVTVDGTSISAPDWAAFFTLVNSLRAAAGKGTLSQAGFDLYQAYYSGNYGLDFHDIVMGSNGSCGSQCNAASGYDLVTGIGTFQANNLVSALVEAVN